MATPKKPRAKKAQEKPPVVNGPVLAVDGDPHVLFPNMLQYNPDLEDVIQSDEYEWSVSITISNYAANEKDAVSKAVHFLKDPEVAQFMVRQVVDGNVSTTAWRVDYEVKKARKEHAFNMATQIARIMDSTRTKMDSPKIASPDREREKVLVDLLTGEHDDNNGLVHLREAHGIDLSQAVAAQDDIVDGEIVQEKAKSSTKRKAKAKKDIQPSLSDNGDWVWPKEMGERYNTLLETAPVSFQSLTDQELYDLDEYTQGADDFVIAELSNRRLDGMLEDMNEGSY